MNDEKPRRRPGTAKRQLGTVEGMISGDCESGFSLIDKSEFRDHRRIIEGVLREVEATYFDATGKHAEVSVNVKWVTTEDTYKGRLPVGVEATFEIREI